MPDGNISALPAAVQAAVQSGFLKGDFVWGLMAQSSWSGLATPQKFPANLGEKMTFTKPGLKQPVTTPKTAASYNSNINNGKTSSTSGLEQYSLGLKLYGDLEELNIVQKNVAIKDLALKTAKTVGIQAGSSRDRLAKNEIVHAHMGGNTRVLSGGTTSTTQAHVDDITGFLEVLVDGVPTAVGGSVTLQAAHYNSSGVKVQDLTITAVAADVSNVSTTKFGAEQIGVSGQITFNTATQPAVGDAIIAETAYPVYRPNGKRSTVALGAGDVSTFNLFMDVVERLRRNNVPTFANGLYLAKIDPTIERQLLNDSQFLFLLQGTGRNEEMRMMHVYELAGVRFEVSTEACNQFANEAAGLNYNISRAIVMGPEAVMEADWDGLDIYSTEGWSTDLHYQVRSGPIVLTLRGPIDASAQVVTYSWDMWTGFAVPTDKLAGSGIISTADDKVYRKRAIVIEVASSVYV